MPMSAVEPPPAQRSEPRVAATMPTIRGEAATAARIVAPAVAPALADPVPAHRDSEASAESAVDEYDPESTEGESPAAIVEPPATPTTREAPMLLPVSAEDRQRILRDPLVAQALDLFDGQIVNMQRVVRPAPAATTPDETE